MCRLSVDEETSSIKGIAAESYHFLFSGFPIGKKDTEDVLYELRLNLLVGTFLILSDVWPTVNCCCIIHLGSLWLSLDIHE